ncbi:hypothetical protein QTO34_000569 [Cnephaeus nilssonii]|uniref:Uncharacterized protein n=1 Tax=Cnephaeus nilssonii TaxID=3371016 RepID=A0AA40LX05_CNENI|nr:hypothetical protein QTO34_000569 [Eptesicus nilssonii]
MFPLHQASTPDLGPDGQPFMIYVPFSTSDLYNWKNQNPLFSQNLQGLISLLEFVFFTHQPTWDDCQQLLQTLSPQKRERESEGKGGNGQPTTNPWRIEAIFSSGRPQRDPNTDWGREALDRYCQTLLRGIRAAARKPTYVSKITETIQGPNKSPTAFLERLCEAYRVYTPIDPDASENRWAINVVFVSQSAPDIRKKLQKLEGFEGKSLSELVKVAQKVFNNREDQTANLNTRMAKVFLAINEGKGQQREMGRKGWEKRGQNQKTRLWKNQCAYCKKEGHWKRECPEWPGNEEAPVLVEEEPRVTLNVGAKPVDFLIDTGATFSVLQHRAGPVSKDRTPIQGATGRVKSYPWTQTRIANLGKKTVTHSFLVMPECPYPLLGRDLLSKLQATIFFEGGESQVLLRGPTDQEKMILLLTCPLEEEYRLHEGPSEAPPQDPYLGRLQEEIPGVWAEGNPPGLAAHRPPIVIQLTSTATPVRSAWNTPLLPVQKPGTEDFRPVQDLREVNKRVETIQPTVPNLYTLLSLLQPEHRYYTFLDLKDAFFSLPLVPQSQPIFAFEWTDPEEGESGQLTWTRLPQGFKNSPTLFDEALNQDLKGYRHSHPGVTLLQYVNDLLLATGDWEKCQQATLDLLVTLDQLGYRVSAKKAQLCSTKVTYLGYNIEGKWTLSNSRVQAILSIPTPKTKQQILGFAEIAKPLYSATGGKNPSLSWTDLEEKAFQKLKQALVSAPALALPDLTKPFQIYVAESQGVAKGVLTQTLGPWKRPVAYLSKRLDPVAAGWPGCLKAIAATAILVKEASKLTFGQDLQVVAPHAVETLLHSPPERWLSNAHM